MRGIDAAQNGNFNRLGLATRPSKLGPGNSALHTKCSAEHRGLMNRAVEAIEIPALPTTGTQSARLRKNTNVLYVKLQLIGDCTSWRASLSINNICTKRICSYNTSIHVLQ